MKKNAYTLIEIVVVISIIIVLSAVSMVSFNWYFTSVRDTSRISQLVNISEWVVLKKNMWDFLQPEWSIKIKREWRNFLIQWFFWRSLLNDIDYSNDWVDPEDGSFFTYVTSYDGNNYQLMTFLEDEKSFKKAWYQNFVIKDNNDRIPYVVWNKSIWVFLDENVIPLHDVRTTDLDISNTWESIFLNVLFWNNKIVSNFTTLNLSNFIYDVLNGSWDSFYNCSPKNDKYADYTIWSPTVSNTKWQNVNSSDPCYFSCKSWFTWNWTNCKPDSETRTESCTWLITNAVWNSVSSIEQAWNTSIKDFLPLSDWEYNTQEDTSFCRFKCNTLYTRNASSWTCD